MTLSLNINFEELESDFIIALSRGRHRGRGNSRGS